MANIETIRAVWGHDHTIGGRTTVPVEAYNAAVVLARQDIAALLAEVAALRGALAALVEAWGVREQDWYRDDYDTLIDAARALLAGARADGEGR